MIVKHWGNSRGIMLHCKIPLINDTGEELYFEWDRQFPDNYSIQEAIDDLPASNGTIISPNSRR